MTRIECVNGVQWILWRARLRDEMPYIDRRANPLLWFGQRKNSRDIDICGMETFREVREAIAHFDQEVER